MECPVIVHASLKDTEVMKKLQQQRLRVRVSQSTVEGSCIFPMSGVAFLLVSVHDVPTEWPPIETQTSIQPLLVDRIHKFLQVHRHCYLIGEAALHGSSEQIIMAELQQRFLTTQLQLLPAHNSQEVVDHMLSISTVCSKPVSDGVRMTLHALMEGMVSEESLLRTLQTMGLSTHHSQLLQDYMGSLGVIASASLDNLLDCALDTETAQHILHSLVQ